jgi:hypothetical protein
LKARGLGFEIENNRVFKKGWNLTYGVSVKGVKPYDKDEYSPYSLTFWTSIVASP